MGQNNESFNAKLYKLLKVRGYKPVPLNSQNQRVQASQAADVIEFTFTKNKKEYGKAWISIDDANHITVYYDSKQEDSPTDPTPGLEYNDTWTGFLINLKKWAQRRQLGFELSNKDRLGDDMRQRDYYKMKEKISEGYYAMGKSKSYNDNVPNIKIILQHNRNIEEGEQRYRNVSKIYLENVDGERFLAPTNKPGVAQIYARHLAEGGQTNDDRWNHLKGLCEEYSKMAGFVRATRNGEFTESAQQLVQVGINHYNNLRESLSKLRGSRGYNAYFESWSPPLMEDENDSSINELFVQETLDPRIESVMPILSRLHKKVNEMNEVGVLESWADSVINEKLELDEYDDHEMVDTKTDMRKTGDHVTDAHDKAYATLKRLAPELYNFIRNEAPMPIDPIQTVDYLRQSGGNAGQLLRMLKDHIKQDTEKQYDKKHPSLAESMKRFLETLINEGLKDTGWMNVDDAENSDIPAFMRKKKYDDEMKSASGGKAVRTVKNDSEEDLDENFISMDPQAVAEEDVTGELKSGPIEAYGVHGMKSKQWRKIFKNQTAFEKWLDKNEGNVEVYGTREVEESLEEDDLVETHTSDESPVYNAIMNRLERQYLQVIEDYGWLAVQQAAEDVTHGVPTDLDEIGSSDVSIWTKQAIEYLRAGHYGSLRAYEGLDANQKRVDQLGPTEKVKNNNIGKLVGANESTEYNEEMARIIEIARFKR